MHVHELLDEEVTATSNRIAIPSCFYFYRKNSTSSFNQLYCS